MKKYITVMLLLISININAEQTSTRIGAMKDFVGNSITLYVSDNNGNKTIFIMTAGRHRIRKASVGLTKMEALRLKRLIDKALTKFD